MLRKTTHFLFLPVFVVSGRIAAQAAQFNRLPRIRFNQQLQKSPAKIIIYSMREITISANDAGQRLDRFLKKYLANAPLSAVYKIMRKDVKVNGSRRKEDYMLSEGEVLQLYLADAEIDAWARRPERKKLKRQFTVIYEDDNVIIVNKPFGLLVHGDKTEKKDTLANQVVDYLIESGSYDPRAEKSFVPSPAHRLDRNTTGMVVFGKNAPAQRELAAMFREEGRVAKHYYTIVHGKLDKDYHLKGRLLKDEQKNIGKVLPEEDERGKYIETIVRPAAVSKDARGSGRSARGYSIADIELVTGRSHQIRAHLASIGHPLAGDTKYGGKEVRSQELEFELGKTTQALHAYRIDFIKAEGILSDLNGKSFTSALPKAWGKLIYKLFGKEIFGQWEEKIQN